MIDIGGALTAVKTIAGVAKEAGRIDLTQQVIDLQQTLLDLLAQNTELSAKVAVLEAEVRRLGGQLQHQDEFVYERNSYWRVTSGDAEGPYCGKCFDAESKAVHLQPRANGYWTCPSCNTAALVSPDAKRESNAPRRRLPRSNWATDY
jgi:hypothetical protein